MVVATLVKEIIAQRCQSLLYAANITILSNLRKFRDNFVYLRAQHILLCHDVGDALVELVDVHLLRGVLRFDIRRHADVGIGLALGSQHTARGKTFIVDEDGVSVTLPLDAIRGIGHDGIERLVVPVLRVLQCGSLGSQWKIVMDRL